MQKAARRASTVPNRVNTPLFLKNVEGSELMLSVDAIGVLLTLREVMVRFADKSV
jgi:hypothetical protein